MSEIDAITAEINENNNRNRKLWILATISWLLVTISNIRYNFGRSSPWDDGHVDDVAFTPFTAQTTMVMFYWLITICWQLVYLVTSFDDTPRVFNLLFIATNFMLLIWSYLFARSHYFLSELVTIITFNMLLGAYLFGQSYLLRPLYNWAIIHGSVVVAPLVWTHYVIWWNGAVLFGARNTFSRIIANVLIWEYLVVFGFLMLITGDYLLGTVSGYLMLCIAVGQLFTKVFALQWVFALVISNILFFVSALLLFFAPLSYIEVPIFRTEAVIVDTENAPLLAP